MLFPRRRGVVLVIAMLALLLMAGLVFYVFNAGRHVQQRVVTQHAADSAVTAGAGWVARGLNTVAMNNVEMARLISAVNYLDASPRAVDFTLKDMNAAVECTNSQLARGTGPDAWVRDGLRSARDDMLAHIDALTPVDELLNHSGYDIRTVTFYDGPDGRGHAWAAMEAFDLYSQAMLAAMPEAAQLAAADAGRVNMRGGDALMAPAWPEVPWERGVFDDFERPVRHGLLNEGVDDTHYRRGPYDTVFGWRHRIRTGGIWGGGNQVDDGWDSGWSGGGAGGGGWVVEPDAIGYRVWGPHQWMRHQVHGVTPRWRGSVGGWLWQSRLHWHTNRMAGIKLGYLWPGGDAQRVVDPDWVTDYNRALGIAAAGTPTIHEAQWVVLHFMETKVNNRSVGPPTYEGWGFIFPRGAALVPPGIPKIADYIWRDEMVTNTYTDDDNNVTYSTHHYRYYVFAGANIGTEVEVRNPHNFNNRNDLPAPIDLVHSALEWDDAAARDERLTFLGVAQRPTAEPFWGSRFRDAEGYNQQMGLAQASVWNNHSWDLWTQMWHAQLEPVDDYDRWAAEVDLLRGDALPGIDADELDALADRLNAIAPLADVMLEH